MEQKLSKKIRISLLRPNGEVAFFDSFSFELFSNLDISDLAKYSFELFPDYKMLIEVSNDYNV